MMNPRNILFPCLGLAASAVAQNAQRPNVIFLMADDLGYGDLSCYGATRVSTPNVDSIARNGIRFTDCHAVASTSTPSRYSVLTGEYCFRRHGTDIAAGNAGMIIKPEQYTLADLFRNAGYRTAAIGKWHLGLGSVSGEQDWNSELDWTPRDIGFDYHYLMAATADRVPCVFVEQGKVENYDPSAPISVSYNQNFPGEPTGANNPELLTKLKSSHGHNNSIVNGIGRIGYMKGGGKALWRDEDIADSIISKSIKFMVENKDNPFFMYLCTNDIHVPRYPADRFRGKSSMGLRGDAILQFDYTVGRIAEVLDSLGIADNTLLVITSDNGPVLDDGYQDQAIELVGNHKPAGPWRGGKYSAFEAGTAVPFIVNWPARIKEGKVSEALVSHIDDIGTFAALIGAEVPLGAAYDSQNHLSTWLGEDEIDRDFVVEMAQARGLSYRTKNWKYIEPMPGTTQQTQTGIETGYSSSPQLYNIANSKYESSNVYSSQPTVANQLAAELAALRQPLASADTCFWYHLLTPGRGSRYATSEGAGNGMTGKNSPDGEKSQWKFVLRTDGSYDIVNRADHSYIVPNAVQKPALQINTSATSPSNGWTLTTNGNMSCMYAVVSGNAQMNQAEQSNSWKILNWGNGTNTTDAGCRYAIHLVDVEAKTGTENDVSEELYGKTISVSTNYADNLTTGQWYVMFDRGTQPKKHGYLYEDVSKHSLYNTATVPSGNTTTAAKYLVRLVDAGDGKFYIQTGFGNYIGAFEHKQNVPVTVQPQEKLIVEKIANTDGHFYVQSTSTDVVLNANDVGSGDATVVGWNTTVPSSINGNNDWAFYPVTLEDIDPSTALLLDDVFVTRGYQTCGRGNENSLMLRIDLTPSLTLSNASITVNLSDAAQANISSLYIHETTATEFIANIPATPIATANSVGSTTTINIGNVSAGLHHFWLCATVKDDAELGAILEATLTSIEYTCQNQTNTITVPASKTPLRQGMKVFNQQTFVFQPTTDNNRFYRIPAMILDKEGYPVVAIDRRGNNNDDLGAQKVIDVSIKRSLDKNGRTWSEQKIVAIGKGSNFESRCGFGDAALARGKNGRLICLMACGSNNYFGSNPSGKYNTWIGMLTSDDNGETWQGTKTWQGTGTDQDPVFITEDAFGGRGQSLFVSSGKGVTTEDGTVMFTVNVKRFDKRETDCYILATKDEGETWELLPNIAFSLADESKLEQLNDGRLLLSVRQPPAQTTGLAARGMNWGSADGVTWGTQTATNDIMANPTNGDIIYHSRTTKGEKRDIMFHSHINSNTRESLQLSMSVDGGASWHDVYNIQPNGSCYSTMQVLNDGSLAILYEDASFCTDLSDPFKKGNGFAINFVTITEYQINEWYDEIVTSLENPTVKIVEYGNTDGNAPWGSWNPASGWANKFTTSAASGMAGVVVSATYNGLNRQYLNGNGTQRVFVMKPSAAKAQNDVFTITAPEGYIIESYTIGGYTNNNNETYTLTAENGESVAINQRNTVTTAPNFLNVTGINASSTTIMLSNDNGSNDSFTSISHFVINLKPIKKALVLLDDDREVEYPNADRISDNLTVKVVDVTLHGRTLYKDNSWNTLCLPFAIDDFAGTPLENAEVRSLESASFNNGTLTLNFSERLDATEAGKPYIVRWTMGDDIKNPVFTNVQFDDANAQLVFDNLGMIFKGIYTPFVFDAQDKSKLYMGSENKLYYPKKSMAIKAFRAFFDLGDNLVAAEPTATAGAKEITNFVLNFGETTGVSSIESGTSNVDHYYSIDGRRLSGKPTQKGVYIVNEKKLIK